MSNAMFREARKVRLMRDGKWEAFLEYRQRLRDQGYTPKEADSMATAKFLPDGIRPTMVGIPQSRPESQPDPRPDPQPVSDPGPDPESKAESEPEELPPPPPRADLNKRGLRLSQFRGKKRGNSREIVEWIFDHIDVVDVTPDMAPSPGAWSLLMRLRTSAELLREFYRTVWTKLLPSRTQIESEERFRDDGREIFELITRNLVALEEPVLQDGSEESQEQFEISVGFGEVGVGEPG